MGPMTPVIRLLGNSSFLSRCCRQQKVVARPLTTYHKGGLGPNPHNLPPSTDGRHVMRKMKVYPAPPNPANFFKTPINDLHQEQIAALDPTGARTRLFSKTNREAAKVGDVLLVRQKNGDPFAGVCINIRRRGVETGILLRNQLTRVGVEMWYKIYSPNVEGIEVVQRRQKRARRARLTYMRKPKHDMGSVENIVAQYKRMTLSAGGARTSQRSGKKKTKGKK